MEPFLFAFIFIIALLFIAKELDNHSRLSSREKKEEIDKGIKKSLDSEYASGKISKEDYIERIEVIRKNQLKNVNISVNAKSSSCLPWVVLLAVVLCTLVIVIAIRPEILFVIFGVIAEIFGK